MRTAIIGKLQDIGPTSTTVDLLTDSVRSRPNDDAPFQFADYTEEQIMAVSWDRDDSEVTMTLRADMMKRRYEQCVASDISFPETDLDERLEAACTRDLQKKRTHEIREVTNRMAKQQVADSLKSFRATKAH